MNRYQIQGIGEKQAVHRLRLDNGVVLIVGENPTADLIAGRIFLKNAGSLWESKEKAGLSNLLATVITKGTERLSSGEIAEAVESIGASLGANAASDYFMMGIKTVSSDFAFILALMGEILRSPTFPEAEVALEKHLIIQSIRSQQEQPFNVAFNQLRGLMYQEHPYGFSILGTEETVSQLCRDDLINYHNYHFRPDNLIISLSGRITLHDAISLVEKTLGDWEVPSHTLTPLSLPPLISSPVEKITFQETQQSIVMLGYLTGGVKSPEYPVLKLLSTYLGNGLSSRLFVELREKRGLAYDVSALYPTRLEPSQFVVYMGTAPDNTSIAIEGLQQECERLCYQELTPEELQGAKNKLLGQYALGKQTNSEIAQLYGWYETLGLGVEFDQEFQAMITEVTSQIAQSVAKNYLLSPYLSVVGPN
ncbi:peptidase M16 domain protein [Rippkaea orientalis PCC 8801]|uniref:Peptidase M16 domain protein n=1 Tax=Rippkaea orientalis (strain PCC 8801 / RF-1) TaxID=41431 RepID=B7K673_RIPO1|nr:pitrilysin family protein [Rippkaea orientalis]ACK68126.1 peptidase M16 domain protein [Rippkaea orientalis PCC 8801]